MHLHTLLMTLPSKIITCEGCPKEFRLAEYDEAVFVQMTDTYLPDGPFLCENNVVVVPYDFTLWMEEEHADSP